jgi:glycosyltransferase involved in cell wall biosynthesis
MSEPPKLPAVLPAPLSVILPVYNQEATLEAAVESWVTYLESLESGYEVLLVDDGSADGTAALVEGLRAKHVHLRGFRHEHHRGFGAALRTALAAAQHPLLAYTGFHSPYQPADLKGLLKWINEVHLVAGYRVCGNRTYRKSWGEWAYRWMARWIFGVQLRDAACLLLLARRSIFDRIPIQSEGLLAHVEVVAKANFLGCMLTEVAVPYPPTLREAPLGDASLRQTLREARRLFSHPDFGPPFLPEKGNPPPSAPA